MDYSSLKPYFTPEEIRIFFGSRKQHEIEEAARFIGRMKREDQRKFKAALHAFNTMRLTEKTHAGK